MVGVDNDEVIANPISISLSFCYIYINLLIGYLAVTRRVFFLQNELAILEFIHLLVETMDRHFGNVVSLHLRNACHCFMTFINHHCILNNNKEISLLYLA